jgi:transcriptional antiterminator NusG
MDRFHSISSKWFAIQTRYRYEHRTATELTAKGIESFLPIVREVHNWKDRSKTLDVPVFNGYLFARFEATLRNRVLVLETAGVSRILGKLGMPEPVADVEMAVLRQALESGMQYSQHPYLAIGTPVRIKRGPLQGLEGRVIRGANALKLVINISSIYQAIAVQVALEDVEAAVPSISFSPDWIVKPISHAGEVLAAGSSRN